MNKKIICLLFGAIILVSLYVGFISYRNNTDRLFARFQTQLKEERFDELYEESSDYIRSSSTKQQFVERMKIAASKLKSLDESLEFKRDVGWEKTSPEFPKSGEDFFTVQALKKDGKSAWAVVYWNDKGLFPKFKNIIIVPTDYSDTKWSDEYAYKGVLN